MTRLFRKIIRIQATDSPNVALGLMQEELGLPVTHSVIIPGLLTYDLYKKRRQTWDHIRQCIGLDGMFYEGSEILLFPPLWLNRAEEIARQRRIDYTLRKYMGVDPAEGGDSSSFCVIDKERICELVSIKTPDTTFVTARTKALAMKWRIAPEDIYFDRGGGGKEHADRLRLEGMEVNTVSFGEGLAGDPMVQRKLIDEKLEEKEGRFAYVNRRAQMYGMIRLLLDPVEEGFGIPEEYYELRRQLAPIPLTYDQEGKLYLLPKNNRNKDSTIPTLTKLLGCSPDEADSLALAVYAMLHSDVTRTIQIA